MPCTWCRNLCTDCYVKRTNTCNINENININCKMSKNNKVAVICIVVAAAILAGVFAAM